MFVVHFRSLVLCLPATTWHVAFGVQLFVQDSMINSHAFQRIAIHRNFPKQQLTCLEAKPILFTNSTLCTACKCIKIVMLL